MYNEKEVERLKKEKQAQIDWLTDFIKRWDKNEETQEIEQGVLIDEYSAWLAKEHQMEGAIADELLEELKDQLGCIEDGKF